jgi:DNA-binding transcriptional LysR family regulator
MDRLETRELAYFVAVAEELHFGRAAARLSMAQPPLSRAIALLERRVGVRLLERTSRRVALTSAGETFLVESRKALDAIDAAGRRARQAAVDPRPLVLAVRPGSATEPIARFLDTHGRRHSTAVIDLIFTHDQAGALRDGTADIAIMCSTDDLDNLHTVDLAIENPVVLLPTGHHLATHAAVTLGEVHGLETFQESCPTSGLDEIIDLVGLGRLIVIVGDGIAGRLPPSVSAVSVVDLPATLLLLAWPTVTPTPELSALLQTAATVSGHATRDRVAS